MCISIDIFYKINIPHEVNFTCNNKRDEFYEEIDGYKIYELDVVLIESITVNDNYAVNVIYMFNVDNIL